MNFRIDAAQLFFYILQTETFRFGHNYHYKDESEHAHYRVEGTTAEYSDPSDHRGVHFRDKKCAQHIKRGPYRSGQSANFSCKKIFPFRMYM